MEYSKNLVQPLVNANRLSFAHSWSREQMHVPRPNFEKKNEHAHSTNEHTLLQRVKQEECREQGQIRRV